MGTQDRQRELGLELRKLADDVWQVAKQLGYGEECTALKAVSTKLHHVASQLGG